MGLKFWCQVEEFGFGFQNSNGDTVGFIWPVFQRRYSRLVFKTSLYQFIFGVYSLITWFSIPACVCLFLECSHLCRALIKYPSLPTPPHIDTLTNTHCENYIELHTTCRICIFTFHILRRIRQAVQNVYAFKFKFF